MFVDGTPIAVCVAFIYIYIGIYIYMCVGGISIS